MTNVALVTRKLEVLAEHVRRLRERRPAAAEALKVDTLLQDALAMSVLVVVQEALDIALHVASDEGWELASTSRAAFEVLSRHDVIDLELATRLASAVQVRNRIAHGYATVDLDRLWTELPAAIEVFDRYVAAIASFLHRASG